MKADHAAIKASLDSAVGKYKALMLAANPGIPEELVSGLSIEDLDKSLAAARMIADKIRKATPPAGAPPIPAGAPARTGPDIDSLSASEKIKLGLRK